MSDHEFQPYGITELPFGFHGRVFRSPMPFGMDFAAEKLLDQYQQCEIQIVVNLLTRKEAMQKSEYNLEKLYSEAGMQMIALPIPDYDVPDEVKLTQVIKKVVSEARLGKNIVIHCFAGIGRTGTFLACMAVQVYGLDGAEAIQWVRKYIPNAVENKAQRDFVLQYGGKHADHEC